MTSVCLQVVKLDTSNSAKPYFVHYVGWNSRWDEWISEDAIVELTSATPARGRRPLKSLAKVKKLIGLFSLTTRECGI